VLYGEFGLMGGFIEKQAPQHLHEPVVFAVAAVNDCYYCGIVAVSEHSIYPLSNNAPMKLLQLQWV
jgi:hypothetical protein